MVTLLAIFVFGILAAGGWFVLRNRGANDDAAAAIRQEWVSAARTEETEAEVSGFAQLLVAASSPFAQLDVVQNPGDAVAPIDERLRVSGGLWNGSVSLFLSIQALALTLAAVVWVGAAAGGQPFWFGLVAVGIALAPWIHLDSTARQRTALISEHLPLFADLLQMPIAGGTTVIEATNFTANQIPDGPVKDAAKQLYKSVNTGGKGEAHAFTEAGRALGTDEAAAFFAALQHAHLDGTTVSSQLASQARLLRGKLYQQQRAEMKKRPTQVLVITALHLFPLLFIIVLLTAFGGLGGLG